MVSFYSGGGYGSNDSDAMHSKKGKVICSGGTVYGDERLNTLHFGSSGGKGDSDRGGGVIELIAGKRIINKGTIECKGRFGGAGRGGIRERQSGGSSRFVMGYGTNRDSQGINRKLRAFEWEELQYALVFVDVDHSSIYGL